MSRTDYLPSNPLELLNKVQSIQTQVINNQVRWDISQNAIVSLDQPISDFAAAVAVSENPETRTSSSIHTRDEKGVVLVHVVRPFIQGHIYNNPNVTEGDLIKLGLPIHDRTPTPSPDPDVEPELEVNPASAGVLEAKFGGKNERGHAKPKGMHGTEIRWLLSETPPVNWSELTHSEFATRSPLRFTFEGVDRGKKIYFAARWENNRGAKGPWTEIISAIVP
jgi:hypothetical protein